MEMNNNRLEHIDAIRRKFGISLEAVSRYNSLNNDEIKNSGGIFSLNGADREKTLALLYMISADERDSVIQKFRAQAGLDAGQYDSADLIDKYGTMLAAAMIYNPNFYAMAVNYRGAVNAGFAVAGNRQKKNNIIIFRKTRLSSRVVFAAAAAAVVVLFIAVVIKVNNRAGQRINNDWIASLTTPQYGQDGVSFVQEGNEGARIGIRSPLVGTAMAAGNQKKDVSGAIEYYNKAVKAEKDNAALYVNRGIAYTLQGYIDEAVTDFNKAVELDIRNTSAYFNRAVALTGKGNSETDNAIADLMTVISINPDDSEAYYALGVLYFRQYENDETKSRILLEKSLDSFLHIQGYKDADFIFDYLSKLL
jgi:tetratricopeptide (TPR) repeat protein